MVYFLKIFNNKLVKNIYSKENIKMENKNCEVTTEKRIEILEEGVMGINEPSFCAFCNPITMEPR